MRPGSMPWRRLISETSLAIKYLLKKTYNHMHFDSRVVLLYIREARPTGADVLLTRNHDPSVDARQLDAVACCR